MHIKVKNLTQIPLPDPVREILHKIHMAGFEAYAVGGCVRDSLMGRKPEDWDITTSALPDQIKALFPRTVDTGIRHGTVTVLWNRVGYEVTTYRIDGEYEDGRHPEQVSFTASLTEDLKRRDFTINAMAYNEEEGLVDAFGGREDLCRRRICCVGSPRKRFEEDALRMMRAVRFSAQLGFSIEENTLEAMGQMQGRLSMVSAERIQTELVKLLVSDYPGKLQTAYETGLLEVFLPELSSLWRKEGEERMAHCLRSLRRVEAHKVPRLTILLYDCREPEAILKRLKFDNDTLGKVSRLLRCRQLWPDCTPASVRRAMVQVGPALYGQLLEVQAAELKEEGIPESEEKLQALQEIRRIYTGILEAGDCLDIRSLAVTGKDLIALGMKPGKEIGLVLNQLLQHVLEYPEDNTRERLLIRINSQKE